MIDKKCKVCRRAGEKLFLKGDRCFTSKCAMNTRPYPPGKLDSEKKHRSQVSEYGVQMKEKQKIKNIYGVSEKQFSTYVKKSEKAESPALSIYVALESRLDNIVFRMGLTKSRSLARQIVSHGHIIVNGRRINIASHKIRIGDIISVREGSKSTKLFTDSSSKLKDTATPNWITLDAVKLESKITSLPKEVEAGFDLAKVLEFYNK